MASIERTAYPRFPRTLTLKDLQASFTPRPEEIEWAQRHSRTPERRLALLVLLKCFEFLRHFPAIEAIPVELVEHVSATLGMAPTEKIEFASLATLYRHHKAIRELLGVKPYTDGQTRKLTIQLAQQAGSIVETRVDIINITIEELVRLGYELPVFRTLDEIAEQAHTAAEAALHKRITQRLTLAQRNWLDRLLAAELPARRTLYNQIKRSAKKASHKHLDLLLDQLTWLESLPDSDALLDGVPATKLKPMAEMASARDAGDMKDLLPAKRYTLILALIRQMRVRARDDVAEMFIRRIGAIHKTAKEELQVIQARQRELSEELVATLEQVLEILAENLDDASTGQRVRDLLAPHGNLDQLRTDCEAIRVWSRRQPPAVDLEGLQQLARGDVPDGEGAALRGGHPGPQSARCPRGRAGQRTPQGRVDRRRPDTFVRLRALAQAGAPLAWLGPPNEPALPGSVRVQLPERRSSLGRRVH